jgi:2-oxoglutarate ferredoxin oxidoreductase subunit delta
VAHVTIDPSRCKGCGLCIEACPQELLERAHELNARGIYPAEPTAPDECIGCMNCVVVCPDAAITITDDEIEAAG